MDYKICEIVKNLQLRKYPSNIVCGIEETFGVAIQVHHDTPLNPSYFYFNMDLFKYIATAVQHSKRISNCDHNDGLGLDYEGKNIHGTVNYGEGGPPQLILDYYTGNKFILTMELYERDASSSIKNYIKYK